VQLILILSLALCVLGLVENYLHQHNLRKIPVRILVNGTRGKSSVTRLIAGALREAGFRTIAKTTGSEAAIILEDGSEMPVRRPFGPRITEQKALAALAARRGAGALVVECMAVRPESQAVMQSQLVKATIGVITNVRVDHIDEMGASRDETARALASTIPKSGTLVTAEACFKGRARRVVVVNPETIPEATLALFSYPVFAENIALAFAVADELGIAREIAIAGMVKARPDIGVVRIFPIRRSAFTATFINGFAANDSVSTRMIWDKVSPKLPGGQPLVLLYNNRADREFRIAEFARLARGIPGIALVAVSGDHAAKAARLFAKNGLAVLALEPKISPDALLGAIEKKLGGLGFGDAYTLFGIGNIQGMGKRLVERCLEEECFRNQ